MSVNNIKDVKTVDAENFDYLLAESNFRIESVFRSRNKAVIEPNVPVITAQTISVPTTETETIAFITPSPAKTKTGASFTFTIDATDYQLYDLRDAEFDIQAQYAYMQKNDTVNTDNIIHPPRFGNQCMLSLFQNIELFIDGVSVQRNNFPGFSSNAEYALRYPHCKTLEKDFEVNGFITTESPKLIPTPDATDTEFDNASITWKAYKAVAKDSAVYEVHLHQGIITQRIKLSDIFSVVETLPPLYNHKVEVRFQRTPHNILICDTGLDNVNCNFLGFMKFKLFQDVYNTTDQFIASAKSYYSKTIETLITQDKQLLVPIITIPQENQQQSFNLNVDAAYKNKLLTICIPRTTDFAKQVQETPSPIDNQESFNHFDTYRAPANSYTYGGLRYLNVSTANGLKLYEFDMENDGVIMGEASLFDTTKPETQINTAVSGKIRINNYEDVYRQYCKARLHFQQSEDEAIDFNMFIKEYCVFCVDLSCFDLSPNENIRITMAFSSWPQDNYNPYYASNSTSSDRPYMSSSIICNLFCDKVLRLLPNRQIQLADLMTTSTVEVDNSNMA